MASLQIDTNFDIENYVYYMLKNYLKANSKFDPEVYDKAPRKLAKFPTVVVKESNNSTLSRNTSLNRQEVASQITTVIEIYTQDKTIDGARYASKTVMNELKYLVFDFFDGLGARRLNCQPAEYSDHQVDRLVITERYLHNNWNRRID